MALSGNLTSTAYNNRSITFSWTATQSTSGNYSTISWDLKGSGGTQSSYEYSGNFKVVIDGDKVFSSADRIKLYNGTTIASGTKKITHNTDGTRKFTVSIEAGIYTIAVNCSGSKSFTLTDIPRASTASATNANIGATSKITIAKASSSFTHTLSYSFAGVTGTIATKTSDSSISWTVPTSFYAAIPNSKSDTCTITIDTYSGTTKIGSDTCKFTASVSSASAPTLSPTITTGSDTQTLTGVTNKIIKGWSNITVNANATAKNSATIKSISIVNGGAKITSATGTLKAVSSGDTIFTVTDSRGFSTSKTITCSVVDYIKPTVSVKSLKMDTSGNITFTFKGEAFSGSFGASSNSIRVYYKIGSGSWYYVTPTISSGSYSKSQTMTGYTYTSTYDFQYYIKDSIHTGTTYNTSVSCVPLFDWGKTDFNMNVALNANKAITIPNSYSYKSFKNDGSSANLLTLSTNNNMLIGSSSTAPDNIYMYANDNVYIGISSLKVSSINVNGKRLGEFTSFSSSTSISIPNNTYTDVFTVDLEEGVFAISVRFTWAAATGKRRGGRVIISGGDAIGGSQYMYAGATTSLAITTQSTVTARAKGKTTYCIQAYQDTGAALNITGYSARIIRVSPY